MSVEHGERRGWATVTLRSATTEAVVLPGKGGDVLSLRDLDGPNLLWSTPWGLRDRGAPTAGVDSEGRLMEGYAGGWQTVFPNGGDASPAQRTTWGMHGEVWLTPFETTAVRDNSIHLTALLVHSPFRVDKCIALTDRRLTVTETVTNLGRDDVEVMWSQHPAFGAPLLGPGAVVDTDARTVIVDDDQSAAGQLSPGRRADWPLVPGHDGGTVDLRLIPGPDEPQVRMAYLTGFDNGWVTVRNDDLGIRVEWDHTVLPYAWYWLEAHGSPGFPWYRRAYVLGIEPATSIPGHGLEAARTAGTTVTIAAGQTRSAAVAVTVLT